MSIKISALTNATVIQGDEELPLVQSTETKKATVESMLTYPIFEIDLSGADFPISQYGFYYITTGSSGLSPYTIILPDPTTVPGMELVFFNYDQIDGADFESTYQPYLEASTDGADKYPTIAAKSAVKIISINGYWSALNYKA
jgi:hypothetical protein